MDAHERQITRGAGGRLLTNAAVWSPDGQWIVYDTRSDAAGEQFDGTRIEMVQVDDGEVRLLYESRHGACCGVVTFHPKQFRTVFILGPENPSADWQYGASHRQGVIVEVDRPGEVRNLDARDLVPPFTPGALRGGSHVHVWDAAGEWVSFTYNDALSWPDLRSVAVSIVGHCVTVPKVHPRNHDGLAYSFLVTRVTPNPQAGSDDIRRACEESWIGVDGYIRSDGSHQKRALAFQGHVLTDHGNVIPEVFVADLPATIEFAAGPLQSGAAVPLEPPKGVIQRRLTFTADRRYPGIQGPRHWLRSSPDGSQIAFLMRDDAGVVQLWTISPNGGTPRQLTRNLFPISSAFTWSPDGLFIAHAMDHCVCVTSAGTGETIRLTDRSDDWTTPRPEACVFSPDGSRIAFVRRLGESDAEHNQICVVQLQK